MNLFILLLISIFVGTRARKIGYSPFLWGVVSFLYAPLAALYLLADLPDRTMDERRKQEMALLEKQLAKRVLLHRGNTSSISEQTISDERTLG
jgi:hypothetical protein